MKDENLKKVSKRIKLVFFFILFIDSLLVLFWNKILKRIKLPIIAINIGVIIALIYSLGTIYLLKKREK